MLSKLPWELAMYGFVSWMIVINREFWLAGVDVCMSVCFQNGVNLVASQAWLDYRHAAKIGPVSRLKGVSMRLSGWILPSSLSNPRCCGPLCKRHECVAWRAFGIAPNKRSCTPVSCVWDSLYVLHAWRCVWSLSLDWSFWGLIPHAS